MMLLRAIILLFSGLVIVGCQTGTDTDGALKSAEVAQTERDTAADESQLSGGESNADQVKATEDADNSDAQESTTPVASTDKPEAKATSPESETKPVANADPIAKAAADIAKLKKKRGERVAVETVFACYTKARERSVSLEDAQKCAAQDFALSRDIISRRKPNATGTGDRALLVSRRHAARIGALMQLKGMGQSAFNTFGKYLHAVAEPAYKKALNS